MGCSNRLAAVIKFACFRRGSALASGAELNATPDQTPTTHNISDPGSPFLLENESGYQAWRRRKLNRRTAVSPTRLYRLNPDRLLPESELGAARRQVEAFNFVLFESADELDKPQFLALNRQFGLHSLDANLGADPDRVTSLYVVDDGDERAQYIPYTSRALNWHTDGYYNPHARRINAFALYCVHQADRGGGNYLFDHEMMYLLLRDRDPELLQALMSPDMMRVPANVQGREVIRAEESGPVFSIQPDGGLNMRYTSRPRNIVWKSDKRSERALNLVREILMDSEAVIDIRLHQRQGLVCNNVLHGRQAFHDGTPARLIYRARYHDAIDLAPLRSAGSD